MTAVLFIVVLLFPAPSFAAEKYVDAFDRVMKTGTIRCGYLVYSPFIIKDLKTGVLSGIIYDAMEEIGKNASLKIEWAEEIPHDSMASALEASRIDVFCVGVWASTSRARGMTFSVPMFYNAVTAWGRVGDGRFSKDLGLINDPKVTITVMDGTQETFIAQSDFPKAKVLSLPAGAQYTDNFLNIASGKADVSFFENSLVNDYVAKNPGTLEQISPIPLRTFGSTLVVKNGEFKLKELLDQGVQELLYSGQMKKIIAKYEKYPGSFLLPTLPYEIKK
jgi:ABC-type amino acid transport substrate-binding protein